MASPEALRCVFAGALALASSLVGATLTPRPAAAGDGVIEINQTTALAGGITPGDAPGFPVTISTAGSYGLTGPLSVADLDTTAILVTAPDGVTLDLNGFAVRGACPAVGGCSAGAGSSRGIDAGSSIDLAVHDGRVIGFASDGIYAGPRTRLDALFVEGNGGIGIRVTTGSEVTAARAYDNSVAGISATASIVRECSADANLDGFLVSDKTLLESSTAVDNARYGVHVTGGRGAVMKANVVTGSGSDGILVRVAGALVVDNVTYANASGAGISLLTSGSVRRNASFANAHGIYLFPEAGGNPAAYRGNAVGGNTVSTVTNGVNLGENACNGNATCP